MVRSFEMATLHFFDGHISPFFMALYMLILALDCMLCIMSFIVYFFSDFQLAVAAPLDCMFAGHI